MEYNTCHKCGRKIVLSFDKESIEKAGDVWKALKIEEEKGYVSGYNHTLVGSFGNTYNKPIKPICSICSSEQHKKDAARELKHQVRRIIPQLKKQFSCPVCEYHARSYNNVIFKSANKGEMINHIKEKHVAIDIEKVVRD